MVYMNESRSQVRSLYFSSRSHQAMEKFDCRPTDLPPKLYRLWYPGCQTTLSGNGLAAKDTNVFYSENEMVAFRQSIVRQMTWSYRGAQPYITCFSEKDHAENWALKQPWNPRGQEKGSWILLTIDTRLLSETYVFRLNDLVKNLALTIPERAFQHVQGAYLCLHRIPMSAIACLTEVRGGTQVAVIFRRLHLVASSLVDVEDREGNPAQHTVGRVRSSVSVMREKVRVHSYPNPA